MDLNVQLGSLVLNQERKWYYLYGLLERMAHLVTGAKWENVMFKVFKNQVNLFQNTMIIEMVVLKSLFYTLPLKCWLFLKSKYTENIEDSESINCFLGPV